MSTIFTLLSPFLPKSGSYYKSHFYYTISLAA
jgi:hypothetical protein